MILAIAALTGPVAAEPDEPPEVDEAELAQELNNPVADIMSFPLQNNFDFGSGPDGSGFRYTLNIQPVLPMSLGSEWLVIHRTILPVIGQNGATGSGAGRWGTGDLLYTAFFSPRRPLFGALIVGAGPVVSLPTGSPGLGRGQWGVGPSVILLSNIDRVTTGALVNHIRSFDGPVSGTTLVQPFASYTFPTATGLVLQTEMVHLEGPDTWSVPIMLGVSQLIPTQETFVSLMLAPKVYLATPEGGPAWGIRLVTTLVVPHS